MLLGTLLVMGLVSAPVDVVGLGDARRYALLIGANRGNAGDATLRYAEADTRDLANLLVEIGDVPRDRLTMLLEPTAEAVRQQFEALRQRIQQDRDQGH